MFQERNNTTDVAIKSSTILNKTFFIKLFEQYDTKKIFTSHNCSKNEICFSENKFIVKISEFKNCSVAINVIKIIYITVINHVIAFFKIKIFNQNCVDRNKIIYFCLIIKIKLLIKFNVNKRRIYNSLHKFLFLNSNKKLKKLYQNVLVNEKLIKINVLFVLIQENYYLFLFNFISVVFCDICKFVEFQNGIEKINFNRTLKPITENPLKFKSNEIKYNFKKIKKNIKNTALKDNEINYKVKNCVSMQKLKRGFKTKITNYYNFFIIFFIVCVPIVSSTVHNIKYSTNIIKTKYGPLRGIIVRSNPPVEAFLGIPYATPPVGNLR